MAQEDQIHCDFEVRSVKTKKDRKRFIQFPFEIYSHNPNWCPPLLFEQIKLFDAKKNPFLQHGSAEFFIAVDKNEKVIGRICASDDPHYRQRHNDNAGFFGMFECIQSIPVAHALLDQANNWCMKKGRSSVLGPIDFSTNNLIGLLVEGHGLPQRIMMNYHPPYYQDLIESWGGQKEQDLVSWTTSDASKTLKWRRKVDRLSKISPVKIRPFDRSKMEQDVTLLHKLSCEILGHQWGFVEPTAAEIRKLRRELDSVPPDLILIAEDGNKPVGLVINIPDYNEVIRPTAGRLTKWGMPFGLFRIMTGLRKIKCARMAVLGVLPDYRFEGIAEQLIVKSFEICRYRHGFSEAEMGWTLENNGDLSRTVQKIVGPCSRRFRVYRKQFLPL